MTFRRPSAATAIAFVALFAALTAPAWGASVSKIITGKQIANNAITTAKVKDGSLLRKDFKKGQLPAGAKGDKGAKGDTGEKGASGAPGSTGATGPTGATGSQGVQGIPGPTVTAAAQVDSGTVGAIGGTLVDLATGATTTGQIVLPWSGRILANGFADVDDAAPAISRTRCNLFISDGTGPNNGLTSFSPNAFGDTPATSNYHIAIPVSGSVAKPAGTYNIAIRCFVVTGTATSYSGSITAIAVPS